ncbi:MAG: phosphatase PAP2 family protein [Acidimicrobiales bacterium]
MPLGILGTASVIADVRVLWPKGLNTNVYLDLNRFARQTPWAHSFMHAYALWLGPVLLAVVFLAVYGIAWWRRSAHAAALLFLGGLGTVISLGFNQLVGHAAKELRPYATHPQVLVLVAKTHDYAFPSDHSVVAGGLTMAVVLLLFRGGLQRSGVGEPTEGRAPDGMKTSPALVAFVVASVVLGLFLCFARVYVGAHYPGDVVAGYLLSAVVVVLASLLRPVAYWLVDRIEPTAIGVLVSRPLAGDR